MSASGPVGFDLDLTLIDSRPAIMAAWSAVSAELGVHIDLTEVDQRMGIKLEDEVTYWFPAGDHELAADSYRRHYVQLAPQLTTLLPGATSAFDAVRQSGERAVVITAKHPVSVAMREAESSPERPSGVRGFSRRSPARGWSPRRSVDPSSRCPVRCEPALRDRRPWARTPSP